MSGETVVITGIEANGKRRDEDIINDNNWMITELLEFNSSHKRMENERQI